MTRISKSTARKMFAQGNTFYMVAVNINPRHATTIDTKLAAEFDNDWDKLYNAFKYYNCNSECGYYPAYYIEA